MIRLSHLLCTTLVSLSFAVLLLPLTVYAQTSNNGDRTGTKIHLDDSQKDSPPTPSHDTVAVLPWAFTDGTDGARRTAREFLGQILLKAHLESIPESRVAANLDGFDSDDNERGKGLPSPKQLLQLGMKLGVDYVIAPRAEWHTRSIWVSLGPKTKSTCTVDMVVIDVKNQEVVLDAKRVKMDDTAKESTLQTLGSLFVSMYITVLSGGPKTPHEQRAAQLATAKAIEPWVTTRLRKIEPDSNK